MKKIICILLTVLLLASMSTAAFAKIKAGEPVNYDKNGIKITYTEDFEKMKGTFLPYDMGLYYDGIGEILFFYYALSREEFNILMEKPEDEWTEADNVFKADEGQSYTIHMLKVPSGYVKNNEEFKTETVYCDIYVSLQKEDSN